ncbi:MAG: T9SS type A sorting domain-containing protein [Bacteroidales bacterium]|nr:T9SS type A sorting domain-containing protein [Bacteroidales bacterium]
MESYIIEVVDGDNLELSCYGTVCEGDIVSYEVLSPICDSYAWQVMGGHVISGRDESRVTVVWDDPHDGYGELAIDGSLCGGNVCSQMIGRKIPIVQNGVHVSGRTTLCVGDAAIYSVPLWGSVEYRWHIISQNANYNSVWINEANRIEYIFSNSGLYKIFVTYGSDFLDCGEFHSDTITVVVKPSLSIVGEKRVCLSNPCSLSTDSAGSVSWRILNDRDSIVIDTVGLSLSCHLPMAGIYRAVAFSPDYCDTARITLVVEPAPSSPRGVAETVSVCLNTTALFHGRSDSPRYSLQWYPTDTTCVEPANVTGDEVSFVFFANRLCPVDVYQYDRELQCRSAAAFRMNVQQLELNNVNIPKHIYVCPNTSFEWTAPEQENVLYRWKIQSNAQKYVSLQGDAMSHNVQVAVNDFTGADSADCYITLERFFCNNGYGIDTFYLHIRRSHNDTLRLQHSRDPVCMNDTVSFYANGGDWNTFYWKADDDLTGSAGQTYIHDFRSSGIHKVQLRYSPFDYCTNNTYYAIKVDSVNVLPAADLDSLHRDTNRNKVLLFPRLSGNHLSFQWYYNDILDTSFNGNYMDWCGYGSYKCVVTNGSGCKSSTSKNYYSQNPQGCTVSTKVPWVSSSSFDTCSGKITLVHDADQLGTNPVWSDGGDDYSYTHVGNNTIVTFHKVGNFRIMVSKDCKYSSINVRVSFVPHFSVEQICDDLVIHNDCFASGDIDSFIVSTVDTQFVFDRQLRELRYRPDSAGNYVFWLDSIFRRPTAANVIVCDTFSCYYSPKPPDTLRLSIGNIFDTNLACDNTPMLLTASLASGTKIATTEWYFGDSTFYKCDSNTIFHTYGSVPFLAQDVGYYLHAICVDTGYCVHFSNIYKIMVGDHMFETSPPPGYPMLYLTHGIDTMCPCDFYDTLKVQWMSYYPISVKYYWNSKPTFDSVDYLLTSHSATYTVRAVNQYMCQEQASAFVPFKNSPTVKITSEKNEYCFGETITLNGASDDNANNQYLWTIVHEGTTIDTITDTTSTFSFVPDSIGEYNVGLCITNAEGCRRCQSGYWIIVNPVPDSPSIDFGDSRCLDRPPVRLLNVGDSQPLHWSNGDVGTIASYYVPGAATAFYYDSVTGCKSDNAQVYIPAAPDFDAIPTGCYQMCSNELPFHMQCYGLTPAGQQIDWLWLCESDEQRGHGAGSNIELNVDYFSTYFLKVDYGSGCAVESPAMVVEESPECECRGLLMDYDYGYGENGCVDEYKVTIRLCNQSDHDYCISDIISLVDTIALELSQPLPVTIQPDSCIEIEIVIDLQPSPEVFLPIQVVSDRCYDCHKDFVLHLVPDYSCIMDMAMDIWLDEIQGYSGVRFAFSADFSGTSINTSGGGNLPNVFYDWATYLPSAIWHTTPSSLMDYEHDGGYGVNGNALFDIYKLRQLAEEDLEVCFWAYFCFEGTLCVAKQCFPAEALFDMILSEFGAYYVRPEQYDEHNTDNCIVVYPNPTTDIVYFKGIDDAVFMEVYDVYGRKLLTQNGKELSLAGKPKGVYVVKIIKGKGESELIKIVRL